MPAINVLELLPGVMAISILFGTTSMLAVTVTFEKKNHSFDRLLLSPIPLELLMLAKTSGAILFGVVNSLVPVILGLFLINLSSVNWLIVIPTGRLDSSGFNFPGIVYRGFGQ